jgi:hypothetical protein
VGAQDDSYLQQREEEDGVASGYDMDAEDGRAASPPAAPPRDDGAEGGDKGGGMPGGARAGAAAVLGRGVRAHAMPLRSAAFSAGWRLAADFDGALLAMLNPARARLELRLLRGRLTVTPEECALEAAGPSAGAEKLLLRRFMPAFEVACHLRIAIELDAIRALHLSAAGGAGAVPTAMLTPAVSTAPRFATRRLSTAPSGGRIAARTRARRAAAARPTARRRPPRRLPRRLWLRLD